ncbi:flagellar hook-basal body complex protein FliE [Pseudoduganella sp. FT25W]|uniref:Flagellar hook-basal body complex protein FliE n=1 Tax=Duganella alba TaxID=2666081 RepID=A0A6L5QIN1_9BURK|nr:flagellar hook-basal body complex protein FliE [Duganella alba]MRX09656.1 flagellar hook-basal body complex protein FliE [Duganella alba]MRX19681.1 flagellar hook-basal body complex protein FliE [Duganella alba]
MSNFSSLIQADLASLTNAAHNLATSSTTIAAANQFGAHDAQHASSFAQSMQGAIDSVNQQDVDAGQKMADVDAGKSDDLVGAMLSSQDASLSFSMLMQVRNKVMGGLDELIKLPL